MILKIEIDSEDALELLIMHDAVMEQAAKEIGEDPILYAKAAQATNSFFKAVVDKLPMSEFERLKSISDD